MLGAAAATPGTHLGSGTTGGVANHQPSTASEEWSAPPTPLAGPGREIESVLWLSKEDAARAVLEGVAYGMTAPRPQPPTPAAGAAAGTDGAGARGGAGVELAKPLAFVPGPYAIAHFLIRDWIDGSGAFSGCPDGAQIGNAAGRSRL